MCLGIPVPVTKILEGGFAEVKIGDTEKKINIAMVPDARVGDYLVLHAGFAITIISAEEAEKTYQMLEEIEHGKEIKSIFG